MGIVVVVDRRACRVMLQVCRGMSDLARAMSFKDQYVSSSDSHSGCIEVVLEGVVGVVVEGIVGLIIVLGRSDDVSSLYGFS